MNADVCTRCGQFGDLDHGWIEGDCILPHRNHSRKLLLGTFVCQPCIDRHREWLFEIGDLYADLTDVLLAGSIPDDTAAHKHTKKAPASPSPLRLDAWALLHGVNDHIVDRDGTVRHAYLGPNLPDVPAVLTGWAQAAYDEQHGATAPSTVSGAVAVLVNAADVMAALPDVDTYDAELRWVRHALRTAHGIIDPQPLGHCLTTRVDRDCGGLVWRQETGDPRCDRCNRRYAKLDLVRLRVHTKRASA